MYTIIGGEGYIGANLAKFLSDKNIPVTTIDNSSSSCSIPDSGMSIRRFRANVSNYKTLSRAMSGTDTLFISLDRKPTDLRYRDVQKVVDTNVRGLSSVLSLAQQIGIQKIIYLSTYEVYGNIVGAKETDTPVPVTMYGAVKLAADAICRGFYNRGMDIVILRLYEVWGGHCSYSFVTQVIDEELKVPEVPEEFTRDYVCMSDVLDVLYAARNWDANIYNVGTGEEVSLTGFMNMHRNKPNPVSSVDGIVRCCADITHIESITGWKPKIFLSELTKQQIKDYHS